MSESPTRPANFIRVWGGEGERGTPTVEVKVEGEQQDPPEPTDEEKAAKAAQDKLDKAEQKAKDADKRAADAEKALQDKEREGMEANEKLKLEHDELQQNYDKLLKFVETIAIDTAIMKISATKDKNGNPAYEWNDATAVRPFIDKEAIKLDLDNHTVDGLEAQLKDVAKRMPFLLVSKEQRDDRLNQQGGSYVPPDPRVTGSHPNGSAPRPRETDRSSLARKYKFDNLVVPAR